jgi:alkylation response protein AidB-like acyl-CoA dehydrogenase
VSDELDLQVLSDSFSEFLLAEWPRDKAVAYARQPHAGADALWQQIADLGWAALTAPESHGGLGLGGAAAAALHAALGAAAAPVPMLGTTLAVELLGLAASDEQRDAWLAKLADGSVRAAFAEPGVTPLAITGEQVSGAATDLLDAMRAETLFVRAAHNGSSGWLILDATLPEVTIRPVAITDVTRTLGTVLLDHAPASRDRFVCSSPEIDDAILRTAAVAIAADALGGGEAALSGTIEYMKVREQFGRLIGSFQALKHRAADHQAALVAARELVEHAAALPGDDPKALLAALTAKQHVTRAVAEIARDCIQLHGGVGFTAEFFPHVYLKRAKLNEALFGTRAELLDRVAELLEAA